MADLEPTLDSHDHGPGLGAAYTTPTQRYWDIAACGCGACFHGDAAELAQWAINHQCTQPHWPSNDLAWYTAQHRTMTPTPHEVLHSA